MPYSKTPAVSTYETKQINLLAEMNSRGILPTTDVDYINCWPDVTKNKTTKEQSVNIRKREGSSSFITLPSSNVRGVYFWEDLGKLFVAVGADVLVYNMPSGTLGATLTNVFPTTTTGIVGFTEFLYDTGTVKLVVTDGTTLSTIDNVLIVVAGADPDMPVHIPNPVFLDGYLFIVKTTSADLYNSNLNDPLAYTTGDFISSEIIPDRVTYVTKLNNYILLFGNDSIEYFWDAANATGSPLQRNDTPVKFTGLIGGITQLGSKIYFVGDTDHSQANVFVLEDFKITLCGNETVSRYLNSASAGMYANIISMAGFNFYVLYAGAYTYVMELESQLWTRWVYGPLTASNYSFNMQFAFNVRTTTTDFTLFTLASSAVVYKFDPSLYQDSGQIITAQGVTNNEEFDTRNRKFMYRLTVWADKPTATSPLLIQWTDDDYQTYNTGITVDLYQQMPCIYRLGSFRRRAFKWTHEANQPLRIQTLEVDINKGQT